MAFSASFRRSSHPMKTVFEIHRPGYWRWLSASFTEASWRSFLLKLRAVMFKLTLKFRQLVRNVPALGL